MFTKSRYSVSAHCSFWTAKTKMGGSMLLFENFFKRNHVLLKSLMIYYFCKINVYEDNKVIRFFLYKHLCCKFSYPTQLQNILISTASSGTRLNRDQYASLHPEIFWSLFKAAEVPFYSETQSQQNRCTFSQDIVSAEPLPFVAKDLAFDIISSVYEQHTMLSCITMQL